MGIKNLKLLLNSKCGSAINQRNLNNYNGMIIGIDLSIFLYKYLYRNNDHIEGLTKLILRLLKNNIIPVFVFDGKPPEEKNETLLERRTKKEFLYMKKEILELILLNKNNCFEKNRKMIYDYIQKNNHSFKMTDEQLIEYINKSSEEIDEDIEKINKKIIHIKSIHIENAKKLFDLFGIKYIVSSCEAETLLAFMSKKNYIDACITEDMDILTNGGKIFLKNFSSDKNYVDEYCLEGILENLNITQDEFIDLCILCGCDYTNKIIGLGCINAYKLIKKYSTIENILENIKDNIKYKVHNKFDYNSARKLFKIEFDDDFIEKNLKDIKMNKPNLNKLLVFLNNNSLLNNRYKKNIEINLLNYYLNIDSITKLDNINKIIYDTQNTPKITNFFQT